MYKIKKFRQFQHTRTHTAVAPSTDDTSEQQSLTVKVVMLRIAHLDLVTQSLAMTVRLSTSWTDRDLRWKLAKYVCEIFSI